MFNTSMDTGVLPSIDSIVTRLDGVSKAEGNLVWSGPHTLDYLLFPNVAFTTITVEFTGVAAGPLSVEGVPVSASGPFDINFPLPPIE